MKPDKFRKKANYFLQNMEDAITELTMCLDDLPVNKQKEDIQTLMTYIQKAFTIMEEKVHNLIDEQISPPRDPLEEEEEEEESDDEEEDESEEDEPTKAAKGRP